MKVLSMHDTKTLELRGAYAVGKDGKPEAYVDPPDRFWETQGRLTLELKVKQLSWDDYFTQLAERSPGAVWWEYGDVKAKTLAEAYTELLDAR